jgi:3-oxo-5-alpha-steroid 4-dehydrogenase 1
MENIILANVLKVLHQLGLNTYKSENDIISLLSYAMLCTSVPTLLALTCGRLSAPYGKYATDKLANYFGFMVNGQIAWVIQELPSFAIALYLWFTCASIESIKTEQSQIYLSLNAINQRTVLLSLYLLHYTNRTFIFPLRIRGGKPTPFGIMMMAFSFCLWNGYIQGRSLTLPVTSSTEALFRQDVLSPRFVIGVFLFFVGMNINMHADNVLRNLRKPGETGYKIPRGGAFEYVSGANFFGEIIEWIGFAIAAWSLPALAFAVFTACNIGPRALAHHSWYLERFKDYPKSRKALIPFIL